MTVDSLALEDYDYFEDAEEVWIVKHDQKYI